MEASTITIPGSQSSLWKIVDSVSGFDAACTFATLWAFVKVLRVVRRRMKTTQLRGPPRRNLVYGVANDLLSSSDSAAMYEHWAEEYGVVYTIPTVLGQTKIVLCDPRAIAHFYARETWTYVHTPHSSAATERLV